MKICIVYIVYIVYISYIRGMKNSTNTPKELSTLIITMRLTPSEVQKVLVFMTDGDPIRWKNFSDSVIIKRFLIYSLDNL